MHMFQVVKQSPIARGQKRQTASERAYGAYVDKRRPDELGEDLDNKRKGIKDGKRKRKTENRLRRWERLAFAHRNPGCHSKLMVQSEDDSEQRATIARLEYMSYRHRTNEMSSSSSSSSYFCAGDCPHRSNNGSHVLSATAQCTCAC